jgi:hypothetical protein
MWEKCITAGEATDGNTIGTCALHAGYQRLLTQTTATVVARRDTNFGIRTLPVSFQPKNSAFFELDA